MNWSAFIILSILLLLFIPIPIKITVEYTDNDLYLYIYKFRIKLFKREKIELNKEVKKSSQKYKVKLSDFKLLASQLNCLKFKPTIRMKISLVYGFFDACSTGIAYGIINSFSPILLKLLSIMFKVKKYDLKLNPNFEELMLEASIKSIIFINLAKIIYILVIVVKALKFIKHKNNQTCKNI